MAPSLCENCHKRPKFGTHKFCGKTCASQAAAKPVGSKQAQPHAKAVPRNAARQQGAPPQQRAAQLCNYCGQKPKFNGFEYCGKSCATLAGAVPTKPSTSATQGPPPTTQKTTRSQNVPPNNAQVPASAKPHKGSQTKVPVPQNDPTEEEEEEDGAISTDLDVYPSDTDFESEDEPSAPAVAVSPPSTNSISRGGKPGSGMSRIVPGTCAIPGCNQPVHVDRNGVKTMYCSTRHREEAVKLGLETACIMCQRYPQSTSDYFCSSACRNQSMTKT